MLKSSSRWTLFVRSSDLTVPHPESFYDRHTYHRPSFYRASASCCWRAILIYQFCPSVCLSVCPSDRDTLVLYENGLTYRHSFFYHTVAQSFQFYGHQTSSSSSSSSKYTGRRTNHPLCPDRRLEAELFFVVKLYGLVFPEVVQFRFKSFDTGSCYDFIW